MTHDGGGAYGLAAGRLEPAAAAGEARIRLPLADLAEAAAGLARQGRFLTLAAGPAGGSVVAAFGVRGDIVELVGTGAATAAYPAVSARVPAAAWPEREARDAAGLDPHGLPDDRALLHPGVDAVERRLGGTDTFVMPYGPVRSGVFEAIQFVVETGGEDVPLLDVRTGFKRRELERRMAGMPIRDAVVVAERIAGISSVAHALAYCQAVERVLGVAPPRRAELWRLVHVELERVANHLHSTAQLAETTALHLGAARFGVLKEDVMRLRGDICGSRFGRGAVVPGGVEEFDAAAAGRVGSALDRLEAALRRDRRLLVGTTSFTDRLFGTGRLPRALAERFAVVGPPARASGVSIDARFERPQGAYRRLGWQLITRDAGDAMARLEVRLGEITQSLHMIRQALDGLARAGEGAAAPLPERDGTAWGWAEAAQGEVLYRVELGGGRVHHVHVASPSLRNWQVFSHCFPQDVLTDFGFIEHSFQLTPAGADR
jgi:formate hydrogenlyase subunit 5